MQGNGFPPGPKFALGAYLAFYRDPLGYLPRVTRQYGDLVHLHVGSRHDYLVGHPDYVKTVLLAGENEMLRSIHRALKQLFGNGLLASQGDLHASQRRLILPAFQKQQIAAFAPVIAEQVERVRNRWRDGQVFDLTGEMTRLTMGVIVKVIFGADIEDVAREIAESLGNILDLTNRRRIHLRRAQRFREARARLDAFIYRLIAERRATTLDHPDFLSALLKLSAAENSAPGQDEQIRDEVMTLFVAGHETVASATSWTWCLLSQHPEVESLVHQELDTVLAGRTPTADDLSRLTYLAMVFSESMRLYPPVWIMTRRAIGDFPLGEYTVPAGSYIHICQYLLQHDARFFSDPERFDPLRWTPEAYAARPRFCYFPFGAGSRKCVGDNFAFMEGMLILAILAQRWSLRLVSRRQGKPQPLVTLRPAQGTLMKLSERSSAPVKDTTSRAQVRA